MTTPEPRVPHHVHLAAVDRMLREQEIKRVRLEPGGGPVRRRALEITPGAWSDIRRVARSHGLVLPEDRVLLGREESAQLAAILRSAEMQPVVEQVLGLLRLGHGLLVRGIA